MADTTIVLDRLTKRFGERVAVDGLSFELPTGGVTGFLGPNGSGKSTTIRMLLGLIRPTSGTASVLGHPITRPAAYAPQVGALIDSPALYPTLSAFDNLKVHTTLAGVPARRIDAVLDRVGLGGRGRERVRGYSLGMKQRLAIAIALLRDPRLLVLDEPTNGLDPEGIVEIRNLLIDLGSGGHTVLVSSHVLAEMQAACDRFVVIRDGALLFAGSAAELLAAAPSPVVARPENARDLVALASLYRAHGLSVSIDHDELAVDADPTSSPDLNRIAFDAGITLRELVTRPGDLEDVFINLTRRETAS
ncbi:MAG: ABC transporter ATP-binding protein [Gaiella sp.]